MRDNFMIPLIILSILIITNMFLNNKDVGKEKVSIIDKIYYSFISFTTVGFGDFFPVTMKGRIISILQNIIIVFFPLCIAYKNSTFQLIYKDNITKIYGNILILLIAFILHNGLYKKDSLNILGKLYHTFVVHTTIGYGDISPSTVLGKIVNVIHPLSVYILSNI